VLSDIVVDLVQHVRVDRDAHLDASHTTNSSTKRRIRSADRESVFRRTGSAIEEDAFELPDNAYGVSASPDGDFCCVQVQRGVKLLRYPSWDDVGTWRLRAPGVDWASKVVWGFGRLPL
jgi:hypothetical protein